MPTSASLLLRTRLWWLKFVEILLRKWYFMNYKLPQIAGQFPPFLSALQKQHYTLNGFITCCKYFRPYANGLIEPLRPWRCMIHHSLRNVIVSGDFETMTWFVQQALQQFNCPVLPSISPLFPKHLLSCPLLSVRAMIGFSSGKKE